MIIKHPIITEKAANLQVEGKYTFAVDRRANKHQIEMEVENLFGVEVAKVQTMVTKGKSVRRGRRRVGVRKPDWKKALVTLKDGQSIDFSGGAKDGS